MSGKTTDRELSHVDWTSVPLVRGTTLVAYCEGAPFAVVEPDAHGQYDALTVKGVDLGQFNAASDATEAVEAFAANVRNPFAAPRELRGDQETHPNDPAHIGDEDDDSPAGG